MRRAILAILVLCPLAAACATHGARPATSASVSIDPAERWRADSDAEDAARIDGLAAIWQRAAARVPARGAKGVAAEGPLLAADAALDHPELPPGSYSCRVVRLGDAAGRAGLRSFPANFCYIASGDDKTLNLTKQTGSDLPAGRLYAAGDRRYVFLGARQRKAGDNSLGYGESRDRDVAGVVERVAPFRWRLVLPARDGRSLDVYELTPVPADRQPG